VTEVHEVRKKMDMERRIRLEPLYYRRQENIALNCRYDGMLHNVIKKLPSVKWCHTKKCWYVPLSRGGLTGERDCSAKDISCGQ